MKKVSVILLLIIYSLASLGIGIKEFYCCGKLKSVNLVFTSPQKEKCSDNGSKEDCCKNKYHFFKVKDTHVAANSADCPAKCFVGFDSFIPSIEVDCVANQPQQIGNAIHAPPFFINIPVYIRNCVFRI